MQHKRKAKEQSKKKNNKIYFDLSTEKAILKFQKQKNPEKKKEIFVKKIKPALDKLIENIIFTYKFHSLDNLETLKNDCLSFLFEILEKFDESKNCKAFSYLSVISKNFFIQKEKERKKKNNTDVCFDSVLLSNLEKNSDTLIQQPHETNLVNEEYLDLLKDEVKRWRSKFCKKQERAVLESIIMLLDNPDMIEICNKKGIYLYLREICRA